MDKTIKSPQPSESFLIGAIMAVAGGFMDAYTFTLRDGVFANAITGNAVLFGIYFAEEDYKRALSYFVPLAAFTAGVLISCLMRHMLKQNKIMHWRVFVLALEIALLFSVGFMPAEYNSAANIVISLRCAIQIAAFKKFNGAAGATTMCTGNLRSGTEQLFKLFTADNKKQTLKTVFVYYGLIIFFVMGAMSGVTFSKMIGIKAIWICCALLALPAAAMLMYKDGD